MKNRDKTESKGYIKRKHIYTLCAKIRVIVTNTGCEVTLCLKQEILY